MEVLWAKGQELSRPANKRHTRGVALAQVAPARTQVAGGRAHQVVLFCGAAVCIQRSRRRVTQCQSAPAALSAPVRDKDKETDLEGGQCARESGTVSGASMASARRGRGCLALCVSAAVVVLVVLAAVADGMCSDFYSIFHPRPLLLHSVTGA
jgi:hypothetical protein